MCQPETALTAHGADGDRGVVHAQHHLEKVLTIQAELKKDHEVGGEAFAFIVFVNCQTGDAVPGLERSQGYAAGKGPRRGKPKTRAAIYQRPEYDWDLHCA
jgi:hypothetical protein